MDPTVLVVDDDEMILSLMRNLLREFHFTPATASSGEEALELARRNPPKVILMDMKMPEMSGEELIRAFRAEAGLQNVPLLILSGEPFSRQELFQIGADGAILKPFDLKDLITRLRKLCGTDGAGQK